MVAGNYVMYVLTATGSDSQDFHFSIPEGQGEVWLNGTRGRRRQTMAELITTLGRMQNVQSYLAA